MAHRNGWPQLFEHFAKQSSGFMGSAWYLIGILVVVGIAGIVGGVTGALMTSFVLLTTAFTITTEIKSTLLLNTQQRQERAMQLKLDELIRAIGPADNRLRGIEEPCKEESSDVT